MLHYHLGWLVFHFSYIFIFYSNFDICYVVLQSKMNILLPCLLFLFLHEIVCSALRGLMVFTALFGTFPSCGKIFICGFSSNSSHNYSWCLQHFDWIWIFSPGFISTVIFYMTCIFVVVVGPYFYIFSMTELF